MTCGKPLVAGTRFCGACGAAIAQPSATSTPAPSVAPERSVDQFTSGSAANPMPLLRPMSGIKVFGITLGIVVVASILGASVANLGARIGMSPTDVANLAPVPMVLIVLVSAIWAAVDSTRLKVRDKTQLIAHPVLLGFGMCLIWFVTFPWYLIARTKIKAGVMPKPEKSVETAAPPVSTLQGPLEPATRHRSRVGLTLLAPGFCLLAGAVWWFFFAGGDVKGIWAVTNSQLAAANIATTTPTSALASAPIPSNTNDGLQELTRCAHEGFEDACLQNVVLQQRLTALLGARFDYNLTMEREGAMDGGVVTLSGSEPHAVNLTGAAISVDLRAGTVLVAVHAVNELTVYGAANNTMDSLPPRIRAWIAGRQTGMAHEQNPEVTVEFR